MSEALRGQQGHPTPDNREAGPMAQVDPDVELPERQDWAHPEKAEAAVEDARAELQQGRAGLHPVNDAQVRR